MLKKFMELEAISITVDYDVNFNKFGLDDEAEHDLSGVDISVAIKEFVNLLEDVPNKNEIVEHTIELYKRNKWNTFILTEKLDLKKYVTDLYFHNASKKHTILHLHVNAKNKKAKLRHTYGGLINNIEYLATLKLDDIYKLYLNSGVWTNYEQRKCFN